MQTKKDNRNTMRWKKERRKMCTENKNENKGRNIKKNPIKTIILNTKQ